MDVVIMPASPASSRLFNPFEKDEKATGVEQSQEKETGAEQSQEAEEKEEGQFVVDLSDLDLQFRVRESFAHEIEGIEQRFGLAALGQPKLKQGDNGKMMELVRKEFIHKLMKSPPIPSPFPDNSADAIGRRGITGEELDDVARGFRAMETARDIENDIIQQYRQKGYAYVELPDN